MNSFRISIIAIAGLLAAACSSRQESDAMLDDVEAIGVRIDKQTRWSLMKADGTLVVADEFDSAPTMVIDGLFSAYDSTGITFYKIEPKGAMPVVNARGLRYAGAPCHGLIPICRPESPIEVIDLSGATVFSLDNIDGQSFNACHPMFAQGLLVARNRETLLWGALSTDGKIAIESRYDFLTSFNCDNALAVRQEQGGRIATLIVSVNGKETPLPDGLDVESPGFFYNHAILSDRRTGARHVFDTDGKEVKIPDGFKPLQLCTEGVLCTSDTDGLALVSYKGNVSVLPAGWLGVEPVPASKLFTVLTATGNIVAQAGGKELYSDNGALSIMPLPAARGWLVKDSSGLFTLLDKKFRPVKAPKIAEARMRMYMSDILLSDRDSDHDMFNTDSPGDTMPSWMEADTEDEYSE